MDFLGNHRPDARSLKDIALAIHDFVTLPASTPDSGGVRFGVMLELGEDTTILPLPTELLKNNQTTAASKAAFINALTIVADF